MSDISLQTGIGQAVWRQPEQRDTGLFWYKCSLIFHGVYLRLSRVYLKLVFDWGPVFLPAKSGSLCCPVRDSGAGGLSLWLPGPQC